MPPNFLSYVFGKPPQYLLIWALFWNDLNLNDQNPQHYHYMNLCSKYNVSRTTLQRIVKYGCDYDGGLKVGCKWASKTLTISNLDIDSGLKVGSKRAAKSRKKPAIKKQSNSLYAAMIDVYNEFHLDQTELGAKIDALQGKSMKSIIAYLHSQIKLKNSDASDDQMVEMTINSWGYILSNWGILDPFYSDQIKLSQINSNLPNILTQLKNNGKRKNTRTAKFTQRKSDVGSIDFDS